MIRKFLVSDRGNAAKEIMLGLPMAVLITLNSVAGAAEVLDVESTKVADAFARVLATPSPHLDAN